MSQQLPIKFEEIAQLTSLGVNAASIGFNTLTMESGRFICVREQVNNQGQVVIIDLANNNQVTRRLITADSVIMHPKAKVMALKVQRHLQVFNLELKSKLKSHLMNEDIVFWKWIDLKTIGLVTEACVYLWSIEGESGPVEIFDRHVNLQGSEIINLRASADQSWFVLVGISSRDGHVAGSTQLYSKARNVSHPIEGHAAAFAELTLENAPAPTKLFSFAVRQANGCAKLHIIEVDHNEGNPPFQKRVVEVFFPPEAARDFFTGMQVSQKFGIVYLVTKMGFIHLYDLETGTCIYTNRISSEAMFITAEYEQNSGIIGVNKKGQVLSVSLDENNIIPYIINTLGNTEIALRLASRGGLSGADDLYVARFNQLYTSGNYGEAAKFAANSPRGILRARETIAKFRQIPAQPNQLSPILQYFGTLLEKGTLNKFESLELAKPILTQNHKPLMEKWLKEDKLQCSEELGDFVKQYDSLLALSVYLRADVPNKVVLCMAENQQYDKILAYSKMAGYRPDYASLLYDIARTNPDKAVEFANALTGGENGDKIVELINKSTKFNTALSNTNHEQSQRSTAEKLNEEHLAKLLKNNMMDLEESFPMKMSLAEKENKDNTDTLKKELYILQKEKMQQDEENKRNIDALKKEFYILQQEKIQQDEENKGKIDALKKEFYILQQEKMQQDEENKRLKEELASLKAHIDDNISESANDINYDTECSDEENNTTTNVCQTNNGRISSVHHGSAHNVSDDEDRANDIYYD